MLFPPLWAIRCSLKSKQREPSNETSRHRAFTLVEILIVIAIVTVLAALLLPVFNNARQNGRNATCQSNLKQIGLAMELYADDYRQYYPSLNSPPANCSWSELLAPYVKSNAIFTCPEEPREFYQPGCPPNKSEDEFTYHYDGGYIFNALNSDRSYISRSRIRRPSQYVFVLDGEPSIAFTAMNPGNEPATAEDLKIGGARLRHRERANTLFADGHVKSLSAQELGDRSLWNLLGRPMNTVKGQ